MLKALNVNKGRMMDYIVCNHLLIRKDANASKRYEKYCNKILQECPMH